MTDPIAVQLSGQLGGFALAVEFTAPMRGIIALFGPSGCGKTSVLRSLAGLNRLPGSIRIGAEIWQDETRFVPPHRRPIGYVFQEASLFPHLSVHDNLTYGARRTRGTEQRIRFDEVVDLLGLARLISRDPGNLSGGERQRVSIGRALLSQPRLMLMDEPLSALDRMAKDEILPYFEALHANLSIPILYVTHDLGEVERLADHLVLLQAGRVLASGLLNETMTSSMLAARRDVAAVIPGRVSRLEGDGIAAVAVPGAELLVLAGPFMEGQSVRVRLAASDVSIARTAAADTSILNALPATILAIEPQGEAEALVRLVLDREAGAVVLARISARSLNQLGLAVGERVIAQIKGVSLLASREGAG